MLGLWLVSGALAAPVQVAAGQGHACALEEGRVRCWGGTTREQMMGEGSPRKVPVRIDLPPAQGVAAGARDRSCAVLDDGTVACWGFDGAVHRLEGVADAVQVVLGGRQGCVRTTVGQVRCFDPSTGGPVGPALEGLPRVVDLDAGEEHVCALAAEGTVWCWGAGDLGQLGRSPGGEGPGKVDFLADAVALGVGGYHGCAVRSGGSVVCWGDNLNGQLGNGSRARGPELVAVRGLDGVSHVEGGFGHTCARRTGGELWCWGASERGQLGLEADQDQLVPRRVPVPPVTAMALGQQHTCAVVEGEVWCWGANGASQLGDGGRENRETPRPVSPAPGGSPGR